MFKFKGNEVEIKQINKGGILLHLGRHTSVDDKIIANVATESALIKEVFYK